MSSLPITAKDLRALPDEQVKELLEKLGPEKAEELKYTWPFWARPDQLEPQGKWKIWMPLAGRGWGKLIDANEVVYTYNRGLIKVSQVEVGDYLFDENGKPTRVLKTFDAMPQKAYRLKFSDGTYIDCCDEHQWVTWVHRDRKAYNRSVYETGPLPEDWPNWKPSKMLGTTGLPREVVEEALTLKSQGLSVRKIEKVLGVSRTSLAKHIKAGHYVEREPSVDESFVGTRVKTTQDIVDTFTHGKRGDLNHSIPLCKPLDIPKRDLIVDPYIYGYWLGDGYKKGGTFTCDSPDQDNLIENLTRAGYTLGKNKCPKTISALGLIRDIKRAGVLNKEITRDYIHCSIEQRLAVLQGLMDSDGYVEDSKVEFSAKRKSHADYVVWLARSLGQKPVMSTGRAMLNGADFGEKYRVTWRPAHGINPFRLPRKANKVTFGGPQESRNHHRMIVGFEEIAPKPMRCFTVDSPNSLFLVGEGLIPTHNTRCGAEWVRHRVMSGDKRIACIAPTKGDVRRVMVEGESGLLNVCWKNDKTYKGQHIGRPIWQPTNNTITWENGAKAEFFSAEDPERLRGPQFHSAWCDELAAWRNVQDVWDMLQFTLRLGKNPRILVTTTPKPIKLVRRIVDLGKEDPERYIVTTGSSYDNKDNIDLEALSSYEGTRLGRQELYAEILEEAAGALWSMELLDKAQVHREEVPLLDEDKGFKKDNLNLQRIVVAVDPAITSNEESDMTGIVVAGIDVNGTGYVLEDATGSYKPAEWAQKAIDLFYEYKADRIVAERNQGGDMVRHTLQTEDSSVPLRLVHASRGKYARAEPVSALYEQSRVKHLPNLDDLERQMTTWEPLGKMGSPDRLDACFVAGTPVLTDKGYRPIESISIGDKVLTREGYKKVVWSGLTKKQSLTLDIGLSSDYVIQATKEHPFYVQGKGWTRADELEVGDNLVTQEEVQQCASTLSKLSSTVNYTDDTQTIQISQSNDTTPAPQVAASGLYTEMFGSTTTDQSLKETTSTTKMETTSTTIPTTLSVSHHWNTLKSIKTSFTTLVSSKWTTLVSSLRNGTALRPVKSFIAGLGSSLGKIENLMFPAPAQFVVENIWPTSRVSSAQRSVTTNTITRNMFEWPIVQSAVTSLNKASTDKSQKPAPVSVVRVSESKGLQDVYNLHVEDCHEFVACGVLVHNCVWALTDLMLGGVAKPQLTLSYKNAKEAVA